MGQALVMASLYYRRCSLEAGGTKRPTIRTSPSSKPSKAKASLPKDDIALVPVKSLMALVEARETQIQMLSQSELPELVHERAIAPGECEMSHCTWECTKGGVC